MRADMEVNEKDRYESIFDNDREADLAMDMGGRGDGTPPSTPIIAVIVALLLVTASGIAAVVVLSGDSEDTIREEDEEEGPDLSIMSEDSGYVDTPFLFEVDLKGLEISEGDILWDLGDGTTLKGRAVEHEFAYPGPYNVTLVIMIDGEKVTLSKVVTVAPVEPPSGLLPDGRMPHWNIIFEGECGGGILPLSEIVNSSNSIQRINATISGEERSFVGLPLLDVLDLAGVRFDAGDFTVHGDSSFGYSVHEALWAPKNGGNDTYLIMVEDGQWLHKTALNSTFMLLGPEPEEGDLVYNVNRINVSQFMISFEGPGLSSPFFSGFDRFMEEIGEHNYTVSDGSQTYEFRGFPLWPLLEKGGILRNATGISVRAHDGYAPGYEPADVFDNPESGDPLFLAYWMDGEPLKRSSGPYRLIAPDADYLENDGHNWLRQEWVKMVASVEVYSSDVPAPPLPWGDPIDGSLNITWDGGYRLYTTVELSSMWGLIVEEEVTMVNSYGSSFTNSYSGLPFFDLLEDAGAPVSVGNVTFRAGDGYSRYIDPMELYFDIDEEGNNTLIALTEEGSWLDEEDGPLRLVAAGQSGKIWIKGLAGIELDPWEVDAGSLGTLTPSDILSMDQHEVVVESKGTDVTYSGADLIDLMISLGMDPGTGEVTISGYDHSDGKAVVDGYSKTIVLSDWYDTTAGERPILAVKENGVRMGIDDKGPIRLIVPGEGGSWRVGWVSSVSTAPFVLRITVNGTYHNLTLSDLIDGGEIFSGNIEGKDLQNTTHQHYVVGLNISELMSLIGLDMTGYAKVINSKGENLSLGLDMIGTWPTPEDKWLLCWIFDGEDLYAHSGLLVLTSPKDQGAEEYWLFSVVSIEVDP